MKIPIPFTNFFRKSVLLIAISLSLNTFAQCDIQIFTDSYINCHGDSNGALTVSNLVGSPLIITEVDINAPDFIEIENVSGNNFNATGYYVACSNSYININTANFNTWNLSGTFPAGGADYRNDDPFGGVYWGSNMLFNDASPGWVAICDSSHHVVDIFFWEWTAADIATFAPMVNGNALILDPSQWTGDGLTGGCGAGGSFRRSTNTDTNTSNDWSCGTGNTPGVSNITITPIATDPIISVLWSTTETTPSISGLSSGNYEVQVSFQSGCVGNDSISLLQPDPLSITTSATDILCFGDSNGTASVFASGGTAPISIDWGTNDSSMLALGYSTFTITDNLGCSKTDSVFINEPAPLVMTLTHQEVLCFGDSTGSANAFISGGTPNYSFIWSTGDTTDTANGLPAGWYSMNASDANGCSVQDSLLINAPVSAIDIMLTGQDVLCLGDSSGVASVVVSGGTPGYTLNWSTGDTTLSINGLSAGWHAATAADWNGCSIIDSIEISEPPLLDHALTTQDILCFGDSIGGSASAVVSGGTPNYIFAWSTGDTTNTTNGLSSGWHNVTITDMNGCTIQDSFEITEPPMLSLTGTTNDEIFGNDGSIDVTITGGITPYSISWTNGIPALEDPTGLAFGSYEATVTDANGCNISQVFVVNSQVGISELSQPKFNIIPNPNDGRFNLILSSSSEFPKVEIINSLGQVLYTKELSESSLEINLDQTIVGVYFIRVFNSEFSTVKKFVIQ